LVPKNNTSGETGTEVINHNFSTELAFVKQINARWSIGFYTPVISNVRSSMYEHYGNTSKSPNARRKTTYFGIGDVRVAAYYWLVDPLRNAKANVQVGAGVKLPTGDYRYQDYFHRNDSTKILGPVEQSIQLGDGGTGVTTEYNAFFHVSHTLSIYNNGYYFPTQESRTAYLQQEAAFLRQQQLLMEAM